MSESPSVSAFDADYEQEVLQEETPFGVEFLVPHFMPEYVRDWKAGKDTKVGTGTGSVNKAGQTDTIIDDSPVVD
jgi:hypothetical protein